MAKCPNENSPEWIELERKVNTHEAWKMFYRYEEEEDPVQHSLDIVESSASDKVDAIAAQDNEFELITAEPGERADGKTHFYQDSDKKLIDSVSKALDGDPVTAYQGTDAGDIYSKQGTLIHSIWEDRVNRVSLGALRGKYEEKINLNYLTWVDNFVTRLESTGTLRSESVVGYHGAKGGPESIAGTIDILHFKDDGTYDIYDIKTAHQTSEYKKKLWDPFANSGYKAKRYTAQLYMYGELASRAIGHPPSNYYVIPSEVSYNTPGEPENGIKLVNGKEAENVAGYDWIPGAQRFVDDYFGNETKSTVKLKGRTDLSGKELENITGLTENHWGSSISMQQEAGSILSRAVPIGDKFKYRHPDGWRTLASNKKSEQLEQIVREVVRPRRQGTKDFYTMAVNYIENGSDRILEGTDGNPAIIKLLDQYKGKGYSVAELSAVEGFEKNAGWIMITKGNADEGGTVDLLYTGNEDLGAKVPMVRNGRTVKTNNLFGRLNKSANALYGEAVPNTFLDLKKVQGVMLTLQLLEQNPELKSGKISVFSELKKSDYAAVANPIEILDTLAKVAEDPSAKMGASMKEMLKVDRSRFEPDAIKAYTDYMQSHQIALDPDMERGVDAYKQDNYNKQQLEDLVLDQIRKNKRNETTSSEETTILSTIWAQLNNISIYDNPITSAMSKVNMRTDLPGKIMEVINRKISEQIIKFRKDYWSGYKVQGLKEVDAYLTASGFSKTSLRDRTISDTSRFYEPLFEYKDMKHPDGTVKSTRTMELVKIGSPEHTALPPAGKKFHAYLMATIEKGATESGIKNWDPYMIPLVKGSVANTFYKATRGETSYKDGVVRYWEGLTDNFEFGDNQDEGAYKVHNWFYGQVDEGKRSLMQGISGDEIIQEDRFNSFDTNLEVVLDMFMINSSRIKHMDKLAKVLGAAHSLYDFMATNLIDPRYSRNAEIVSIFNTAFVDNKDVDSGTALSKSVKTMNRLVSFMTLGFNFKSALTVGLGQELLLFSRSAAASMSETYGFDLKSLGQASVMSINPKEQERIRLLLEEFGLHDLDVSALMSGVRQTGNKSFLQSKHAFGMMRYGDKVSKGQFLIAEMIKDGSIAAYSVVDGELVYNEDLDPRFEEENGPMIKAALLRSMAQDGTLTEDGRMTTGYDSYQNTSLSIRLTRMFGGYDRDMLAVGAFSALGKLFLMHKNFMPAIIGRMFRQPKVDGLTGNYEIVTNPDGTKTYDWTGKETEGLAYSMLALVRTLVNYRDQKTPLTKVQKENLRTISADIMTMGLALLGATALLHALGDDDDEWGESVSKVIKGGVRDLTVAYNIEGISDLLRPVSVDYAVKASKIVGNALYGGDFEKIVFGVHPVGKQLDFFIKQLE